MATKAPAKKTAVQATTDNIYALLAKLPLNEQVDVVSNINKSLSKYLRSEMETKQKASAEANKNFYSHLENMGIHHKAGYEDMNAGQKSDRY
jgi:hypothetical protein